MSPRRLIRALAWLLLAGSAALLLASALHPVLPLTAAGDLALIQSLEHWHLLHLVLLYATGAVITGLWARWLVAEGGERAGLGVAFVVAGIGQALNGVNIAYMTGAGTYFAQALADGAPVAAVYEGTHLFAVMCGRLAGFLVALAAGVIAVTTAQRADEPRWLVGIAALAAGGGLIGNLAAPPGHPLMLTSVGLLALWQLLTAARILRYRLTAAP